MSAMSALGLESPNYPGRVMAVWHRPLFPAPPWEQRWASADPSVPTLEADTDPPTAEVGTDPHLPPHPWGRALLPAQLRGREQEATPPGRPDPIRAALTGWNCSSMSLRGRPPACGERGAERGAGLQEGTAAPESP